jgi:hypothetical protein
MLRDVNAAESPETRRTIPTEWKDKRERTENTKKYDSETTKSGSNRL